MPDLQTIDRYEVRKVLGTGAMGSVYMAWDPKLHRDVAIKVVREDVSGDPKWRERFQREARAVATLRHPNVVEIYDYSGPDSDLLYIVMEKLEGDDLFNIVEARGVLPEPAAVAVGHELCLALGVAHQAGIIHRDLKPENVFISPSGRVVLTDFGIVKAVAANSPVSGWDSQTEVIGTPGFMAPELMMNKELGPQTDVFALGALLYNICTQHLPYEGGGPVEIYRSMMAGRYQDPRQFNRSLTPEFCEVLARATDPKPKRRLASVDAMRDALKAVLADHGVTDLRDDLREFMSDAVTYATSTRQRMTSHLIQRLKIATKDRNKDEMGRLTERLYTVDPENSEVHAISGLFELPSRRFDDNTSPAVRMPPEPSRGGGGGRSVVVGAVLVTMALLVAAFLAFRQQDSAAREGSKRVVESLEPVKATPSPPAPTPAVASPAPAHAELAVLFDGPPGAMLYVDGERIGKLKKEQTVPLEPGTHIVEVRARKMKQKKTVEAAPGSKLEVSVEIKKGKLTLK